jgi:hypothetical protein
MEFGTILNQPHILKKSCRHPSGLGRWLHNQRQVRKGNMTGSLSQKRIQLLEMLPGWKWSDRNSTPGGTSEAIWVAMYEKLIAYVKQHGGVFPTGGIRESQSLDLWVKEQKSLFSGTKKGGMSLKRIKLLEGGIPGWSWE